MQEDIEHPPAFALNLLSNRGTRCENLTKSRRKPGGRENCLIQKCTPTADVLLRSTRAMTLHWILRYSLQRRDGREETGQTTDNNLHWSGGQQSYHEEYRVLGRIERTHQRTHLRCETPPGASAQPLSR